MRDGMQIICVKTRRRKRTLSIEDGVYASIRGIDDNIRKSKEKLITATKNGNDNIKINRTIIIWKQKWEEKQLYGYFK